MHPLELLRHLARYEGAPGDRLAQEAAIGLADIADDPGQTVLACRRLTQHHPTAGPVWTLAARVLTDLDPAAAAWELRRSLEDDLTSERVADDLAERADGELEPALAVAIVADPWLLAESERAARVELWCPGPRASEQTVADRVRSAGLVVVEALLAGPEFAVVPAGGGAAVRAASAAEVDIVLIVPEARSVTAGVARYVQRRLDSIHGVDVVPSSAVGAMVRPTGTIASSELIADHPPVPELTEVP